ncbi:MAG: hypothetical protein IKG18_16240 [Atopobiaceae bacterium]|nr:hypothetical protein [Atopobiaceae bacterium]
MGLFGKSYDTIEKARAASRMIAQMEYDKEVRIERQAKRTKSNEKLFLCAVSSVYSRRKFAIPLITDPKALHMLMQLTAEGIGYDEFTRLLCARNTHLSTEDLVFALTHPGTEGLSADVFDRLTSRDDLLTVAHIGCSESLRVAAARACIVRWPEDALTTLVSFAREGYPDLPQLLRSWPHDDVNLKGLLSSVDDPDLLGTLALSLDGSVCLSCAQRLAQSYPDTARTFQPRLVAHAIAINDFALALELMDLLPQDESSHDLEQAVADAICDRGNAEIGSKSEKALTALVERIDSPDLLMHITLDSELAARYDRLPYAKRDTAEHRVLDRIAKRLDDEQLYELITLKSSDRYKNHRHTFRLRDLASNELAQRPGGQQRLVRIADDDPEEYSYLVVRRVQSKRALAELAQNHPDNPYFRSALHARLRSEDRNRRLAAKTDDDIVRYFTREDSNEDIFEDLDEKLSLVGKIRDTEALREVARSAVNPRIRSEAAKRLYMSGAATEVERKTGVCTYCGGSVTWYHTYEGTIEERTVYRCPDCGYAREQNLYHPGPSPEHNGDYYMLR